jgi:serine/threonine-protein kinase RsbW
MTNSAQPAPFAELRQVFASRVANIPPFADQLMRFFKALLIHVRREEKGDREVEIALREALANAVIHGNREDPKKCVYVDSRCSIEGEISITVRDEGEGFESSEARGRGIRLMQMLMDDVRFEERGTVIHMRKRLRTHAA